jgi:transcriptional regulator with GAF, ATPase, and Fis domain
VIEAVQQFNSLLQEVWREVCRHIEIGESVERVAPIIAERLPLTSMIVRRLDLQHSALDTVALAPANAPLAPRSTFSEEVLERVLIWCRREKVQRQSVAGLQRELPGLLPKGLDGEVLAGPLVTDEGAVGILAFVSDREFLPPHEDLVQALLEPFAVAMENDRRVRELMRLREAVEADNRSLLSRLDRHDISDSIVGAETGLRRVMEQIDLVSRSSVPVLILGDTGSGKEVVARAIHNRSPRSVKPFLRVNCGAIPPELVDSELFGHDRGSFTGAIKVRKGWFERADGGTLFLDEVAELPPAVQVRLLRILQDGLFERVGGEHQLSVDVRVIAATHRDVPAMVADGRFREDLWYRISVFPIRLPPLRERQEDIPALAAHFALRAARRLGTLPLVPSPEDIRRLVSYSWPGNVRELAAVIERAAILGEGKALDVAQALGSFTPPAASPEPAMNEIRPDVSKHPLPTLSAAMRQHIELALKRTRGRVEGPHGAARLLAINPHTLRARMRKLGIRWQTFRDGETG